MKKLENVEKKTSESGAASGKSCPLSAASYAAAASRKLTTIVR